MQNALQSITSYYPTIFDRGLYIAPQPQQPEKTSSQPRAEEEKPAEKEKKPEKKTVTRKPSREFSVKDHVSFTGRPVDEPIFHIVSDVLGISEDIKRADANKIGDLIVLIANKIGSTSEEKIVRFLRKAMREHRDGWGGKYGYRAIYRLLKM